MFRVARHCHCSLHCLAQARCVSRRVLPLYCVPSRHKVRHAASCSITPISVHEFVRCFTRSAATSIGKVKTLAMNRLQVLLPARAERPPLSPQPLALDLLSAQPLRSFVSCHPLQVTAAQLRQLAIEIGLCLFFTQQHQICWVLCSRPSASAGPASATVSARVICAANTSCPCMCQELFPEEVQPEEVTFCLFVSLSNPHICSQGQFFFNEEEVQLRTTVASAAPALLAMYMPLHSSSCAFAAGCQRCSS